MHPETLFYIYLIVLYLNFIIGIAKYKHLDFGSIMLVLLFLFGAINETICRILIKRHLGYEVPYHIYSIIELSLTSIYFGYSIMVLNIKRWIILSIAISILIGAGNLYFQHLDSINTNMLLIESFVIISMALYSFYKMLLNDWIINLFHYPHFWFWTAFLLLWSGSFFFWVFFDVLIKKESDFRIVAQYGQIALNLIVYLITGLTLFLIPKKKIE